MITIKQIVTDLLDLEKMTEPKLAKLAGTDRSSINRIKNGVTENPSIKLYNSLVLLHTTRVK